MLLICYNFPMRYLRFLARGFLYALLPLMAFTAVSAQPVAPDALVISFSPPFVNGRNLSIELYQTILSTMREKTSDLASRLDSSGAVWSANQNLSGVQFAIFFSGDGKNAIEISRQLLRSLATKLPGISLPTGKDSLLRNLHGLCKYPLSASEHEHQPVTVYYSNSDSSAAAALASETALLCSIYSPTQSKNAPEKCVVTDATPAIYEIFSWENNSLESFLSAKYTGEMFIKEMTSPASASYEVITSQFGLSLALIVSGEEQNLFPAIDKTRLFAGLFAGNATGESWNNFASRTIQIIEDDTRNFRKKSLFDAWMQHWHGELASISLPVKFVRPSVHLEGFCHPEVWHHDFSYSRNVFPRFSACSLTDISDGADIAISFTAAPQHIKILREGIEADSASVAPLNIESKSASRLVISFSCPLDKVSSNIARIRSRVTGYLSENGLNDVLQKSMKIGIAGAASVQPFELRGHLENGWPPVADQHQWNQPDISSLSEVLMFASSDQQAIQKRWAIATATGHGKALILSCLAARNLMLKHF